MELAASTCPISVHFLRFISGQQIAEIVDNSNDLQHLRREVSRGLFETLVEVCTAYYHRVIFCVKINLPPPGGEVEVADFGVHYP